MKNTRILKTVFLSIIFTLGANLVLAAEGTSHGGGGSFNEQDFTKSGWQKYYQLKRMEISRDDLDILEQIIKQTKVIETEKELIYDSQKKDALNFANGRVPCRYLYCEDPNQKEENFGMPVIIFNSAAWKGVSAKAKKISIAYHEYLGVLKSDRNNYEISARLEDANLEFDTQQTNALGANAKSQASEDSIDLFLNKATNYLDEINALLRVNLAGEALKRAEILKTQILQKLNVDTRTGIRKPNFELSDRIIDQLRDTKYNGFFELIKFQKLFAMAYYTAYFNKTGNKNQRKYLDWAYNFKILVKVNPNPNYVYHEYISQNAILHSDFYNYANIEYYSFISKSREIGFFSREDDCLIISNDYSGNSEKSCINLGKDYPQYRTAD